MKPEESSPLLVVLRCLLCDDPMCMLDSDAMDVYTNTFISVAGVVYCSECYSLVGLGIKNNHHTARFSLPIGHN